MSTPCASLIAPGFFASEAVRIAGGVGAVVAIVAGAVGVFTVMRGQSFAGEALGDTATTGGAGAFWVSHRRVSSRKASRSGMEQSVRRNGPAQTAPYCRV